MDISRIVSNINQVYAVSCNSRKRRRPKLIVLPRVHIIAFATLVYWCSSVATKAAFIEVNVLPSYFQRHHLTFKYSSPSKNHLLWGVNNSNPDDAMNQPDTISDTQPKTHKKGNQREEKSKEEQEEQEEADYREEPTPQQIVDEQRKQIEMLMRIMKSSNQYLAQTITAQQRPQLPGVNTMVQTTQLIPLKSMMFIDGTWLYYSIYGRQESQCSVTKRFGRGWQHYYKVDWAALPRLVCEQLQKQMYANYDPSDVMVAPPRPVEISRNSVYTSYNRGTDKNSFRVKMFQQMQQANMDVHIMETLGREEKCVDIQLAVEMLHYATVPEAYDIAILLSGDKDFVPALVRTRQKGKRVAIVSMRTGCNRALYESPHVKDYNIVWIDDFLDKLIRPAIRNNHYILPSTAENGGPSRPRLVSHVTMMKVIYDFIVRSSSSSESSIMRVESRQIGRHLKNVEVGDGAGGTSNLLLQLKEVYGGLRLFLIQHPTVFRIIDKDAEDQNHQQRNQPRDKSFWVEAIVKDEEDKSQERDEGATVDALYNGDDDAEQFKRDEYISVADNNDVDDDTFTSATSIGTTSRVFYDDQFVDYKDVNDIDAEDHPRLVVKVNYEDTMDYSRLPVAKLKEICREWGLPVSGVKATLLDRIQQDVMRRGADLTCVDWEKPENILHNNNEVQHPLNQDLSPQFNELVDIMPPMSISSRVKASSSQNNRHKSSSKEYITTDVAPTTDSSSISSLPSKGADSSIVQHLDTLIDEYIAARGGGQVGSRDMGRYLAANSSSKQNNGNDEVSSALTELKNEFGSLANYISRRQSKFLRIDANKNDEPEIGFYIARVHK